jgi:hypothetical protein
LDSSDFINIMQPSYKKDLRRRPNYKGVLGLDKHHDIRAAASTSKGRRRRLHLSGEATQCVGCRRVDGAVEVGHARGDRRMIIKSVGGRRKSSKSSPSGRRAREAPLSDDKERGGGAGSAKLMAA